MSFNFPASVEQEINLYAQEERMSPEAAALKLMKEALAARRQPGAEPGISEIDMERLYEWDPAFRFFENLPDDVLDTIEAVSQENRTAKYVPRG